MAFGVVSSLKCLVLIPSTASNNEKKRVYEQRIRDIEHGSFAPLVMSVTGDMGQNATTVYKRLASMLSNKWNQPHATTMEWLRCRLSFSLLRSSILAIRGARSSSAHFIRSSSSPVDLVTAESQVPSSILVLYGYLCVIFILWSESCSCVYVLSSS